jgi:hypothetical protein
LLKRSNKTGLNVIPENRIMHGTTKEVMEELFNTGSNVVLEK